MSKDEVCRGSGLLRATTIEKSISNLVFPTYYLGNMKCWWLILTEPGSLIRFSVQKISFQDCRNCACDYIEIYDGPSDQSKSSGRWCKNIAELLSSGESLYIVMRTDTFWVYEGFKASYRAIPATKGCDLKFTQGILHKRRDRKEHKILKNIFDFIYLFIRYYFTHNSNLGLFKYDIG